ncbi:50S ribosomal protein L9 [Candidatus Peregrinibacteria bacterium]|nr:50S ribosomal protein L9 [Candidatus Peregrinibacteria bacterium]
MKVLFLENVKGVARKGDVKNVSDGYFMNFLAPKKMAVMATNDAVKAAEAKKQKEVIEKERVKEEAGMVKSRLDGLEILIKGKANGSKLYASIGMDDLIKAVLEKVKIRLDKSNFHDGVHLKEVGIHKIEVSLSEGLKAVLKVEIKADPT